MIRALLAVLLILVTTNAAAQSRQRAVRAVWVARWDYRSAQDVRRVIEEVASLGATDVIWQVRGQFDAYYKSSIEPWAEDLFYDRRDAYVKSPATADPGFDPLQIAIAAAHANGLRLHAWINVFPMWKGKSPPVNPDHPLRKHPQWVIHDDTGKAMPLNDHYVVANPAHPGVQEHLARICRELCTNYEIDGLHFDYVRFVSESLEPGRLYPGDTATLDEYRRNTGRGVPRSNDERQAYRAWMRDEISNVVRRLASEARAARPAIEVSAAVWRRPDLARDTYLQDAARWLEDGTLDRAYPMVYTADEATFASDMSAWLAAAPGKSITPGVGIYKHSTPEQTEAQAASAASLRCAGIAMFGYSSMFESVDPQQDKSAAERELRRMRRETLKGLWKGRR